MLLTKAPVLQEKELVKSNQDDNGGAMNMSERELVGEVMVDSGQIAIVDPSHILEMEDFLKVSTKIGDGIFPVYFEEDDEGGYGKSRIIIELVHLEMEKHFTPKEDE